MVLIASRVWLGKMFQALLAIVLAQPWSQPFLTTPTGRLAGAGMSHVKTGNGLDTSLL